MRYSKYIIFAFLIFNFALFVPALGQSSDEYYNKAVNKYFLGDNAGAVRDLNEALRLDPANAKAKELLQEINKESAPAPAAPAPAAVAPAPTAPPAQLDLKEITRELKKVIRQEEEKAAPQREKPAPKTTKEPAKAPPQFIYVKPSAPTGFFTLTWMDLAWIVTALLTLLYLTIRFGFLYLKQEIEKRSIQICTECKYANPGSSEFCSKCGGRLKPWVGITAAQRKWYAKFGWKKNPFTLDIMPKLFTGYQTQVSTIFDKVYSKTGHILVMGNKGVGKTTLLKWLADTLAKEFHTVYIPRPTDNFDDLLEYLAKQLKFKANKGEKITIYDLEALAGKTNMNILLLLDEAHEFSAEFERPLRSLGDLNGINFILAGLSETGERIKKMSPPFYDRIVQQVVLHHLSLEETTDLIRKRIEDAGGSGLGPFTPAAIENIYKMSGGVPRTILKVCDWVITEAVHNNVEIIEVGQTASFPGEEPTENKEEGKS